MTDDRHVQLAKARKAVEEGDLSGLMKAFVALDNGSAFESLDHATGYASPDDVLEADRESRQPRKDPAEWGDSSGYTHGGDHLDFRGSIIEGPFVAKSVTHND
mgnify:CR=1 FL=1